MWPPDLPPLHHLRLSYVDSHSFRYSYLAHFHPFPPFFLLSLLLSREGRQVGPLILAAASTAGAR